MTYLARLKSMTSQNRPPEHPTKLTKGASVSFVSDQGEGFYRNATNEAEGDKCEKTATPRPDKTDRRGVDGLLSVLSGARVGDFGETAGIFPPMEDATESILDAIEERAALCAGSIPPPYLDCWARLNHQKPILVSDEQWRRAVDDGGRFFDAWGSLAAEWGWTIAELFDVPRDGKRGGLVWFCVGEIVAAFGPEYCRTETGRIFDRLGASRKSDKAGGAAW